MMGPSVYGARTEREIRQEPQAEPRLRELNIEIHFSLLSEMLWK